jgi:hypothetical protein
LQQLTSEQLSEWEAYDTMDPIGEWRDDFRMAFLASLIVNSARAIHGKKGTKMSTPADFMPKWDKDAVKEVKTQSAEEMKQILLSLGSRKFDKIKSRKDLKPKVPIPTIKDEK